MSTQNVEVVTSGSDRAKVAAAILAVVAGIVGYYLLAKQPAILRVASVLAGLGLGVLIACFSAPGRRFIAFGKDAWAETRKVTWPERKETTQVTLVVFGFVLAMAVFLWLVDKTLEWALYDLVLGWKK